MYIIKQDGKAFKVTDSDDNTSIRYTECTVQEDGNAHCYLKEGPRGTDFGDGLIVGIAIAFIVVIAIAVFGS